VRRGTSLARSEKESAEPHPRSDWLTSPFAEFDEMWDRMMGRFFRAPLAWPDWAQDWTPAVDVEETEDAWIFEVELPGARREDLQVEIGDAELIISGKIDERERVGVVRHRARRSGSFQYRSSLPAGVDADMVHARLDNGVLTVRVPRPEQYKTRQIEIN
jgi:HSP20 family protein